MKNTIPDEIYSDWQIYTEILFHVIQNAFKFTNKDGEIKISVVYCPFEYAQEINPSRSREFLLGHPSYKKSSSLRAQGSIEDTAVNLHSPGFLLTLI